MFFPAFLNEVVSDQSPCKAWIGTKAKNFRHIGINQVFPCTFEDDNPDFFKKIDPAGWGLAGS